MPGLLVEGKYLTDDWEIDKGAVAEEVVPNFMNLADYIHNALDDFNVKSALEARELIKKVVRVTNKIKSSEVSKQFLEAVLLPGSSE